MRKYLKGSFTAHSLRASFVTVAKLQGADDAEIMKQTKHKTADMIRRYTRIEETKRLNAAERLGL